MKNNALLLMPRKMLKFGVHALTDVGCCTLFLRTGTRVKMFLTLAKEGSWRLGSYFYQLVDLLNMNKI